MSDGAAAGDEHVDAAPLLHELHGRLAGGVVDHDHGVLGQPRLGHGLAQHRQRWRGSS